MSSVETLEDYEEPGSFQAEVIAFPVQYELVTEENIDKLGQPIKMRASDYGKPLADPDQEQKRQNARFMLEEWKLESFVNNGSGLLIKAKAYKHDPNTIKMVNAKPYALFPPSSLSGFQSVELGEGQIGIAFKYYKPLQQLQGDEPEPRIIIPSGFAYGVHADHRGILEMNIPAEPAGWYMVGEQVKVNDGVVVTIGEGAFPLSRIIDGPIGDPRDPKHREAFGIY